MQFQYPEDTLIGARERLAYQWRLFNRTIYRSYPRWFRRFFRFAVHQLRRLP